MLKESFISHRCRWRRLEYFAFLLERQVAAVSRWRSWVACFTYSDAVKVVVVSILVMLSVVMVAYSRVFHVVMIYDVPNVDVAGVAGMLYH